MKELIKEQLQKEKEKLERTPARFSVDSTLDRIARLAAILRDLNVAEAAERFDGSLEVTNLLSKLGGPG